MEKEIKRKKAIELKGMIQGWAVYEGIELNEYELAKIIALFEDYMSNNYIRKDSLPTQKEIEELVNHESGGWTTISFQLAQALYKRINGKIL